MLRLIHTKAFLLGYVVLAADNRYVTKEQDLVVERTQTQKINELDVRLARIEAKCDMIIDRLEKK